MPLSFNRLLLNAGLDLERVRYVRHTDRHHQRRLFDAAMKGETAFHEYQEHQGKDQVIVQFRRATYLAAFVVAPLTGETVFVGIWERIGERPTPVPGTPLMIPGTKAGKVAFETQRLDLLAKYRGRIVIDWGDGTRQWVQRADNQDKEILEVRRVAKEPDFPGFLHVRLPLDQIESVPASWATALRSVRGVYLLVRRDSGEQYVGSAYGSDGILGRWLCYVDGHAGNVAMKELRASAAAYDASILEIVGSDATIEEVCQRETLWKSKLGSRAKGLNRN